MAERKICRGAPRHSARQIQQCLLQPQPHLYVNDADIVVRLALPHESEMRIELLQVQLRPDDALRQLLREMRERPLYEFLADSLASILLCNDEPAKRRMSGLPKRPVTSRIPHQFRAAR